MGAHEDVRAMAQMLIKDVKESPLTRGTIAQVVERVLPLNPAWAKEIDRERVIKELEGIFSVWIGVARTLADDSDHQDWLPTRRASIRWSFWDRYATFLGQRLGQRAIDSLNEITDDILKRLEWPDRANGWDRRGLVVGHVQSGKTANYTGLICKAADAGYRVIVVLAGLHKSLRSQTQIRLDEGFLGYDSTPGAQGQRKALGVGLIDPSARAMTVTNRSDDGDFKVALANHVAINPGVEPLLFVVKKNASVLKNLLNWVQFAAKAQDQSGRRFVSNVPLLVIDDEADNASVDTKERAIDEDGKLDEDHDPTRINQCIRQLLMYFEKRAYVGYTATPFANVFIHEAGATKDEGQDLFPRSFIMNLPAPSNYFGPARVFGLDQIGDDEDLEGKATGELPLIRRIKDHANSEEPDEESGWIPPKHDKSHVPYFEGKQQLPHSLKTALHSFILACAGRRARGELKSHNSMLIHVTRFTAVQALVYDQVKAELTDMQNRLRRGEGANSPLLDALETLWKNDFEPTTKVLQDPTLPPILWANVQAHLKDAVLSVELKKINGTAADVLDYSQHPEGLNVIAVGGDKLARGLTLEGLSVSYFLRASKMYDTLMQMGRWFGYRDGYMDLCRLFMPRELAKGFRRIAQASNELREEFDHMVAVGDTPINYGLRIRRHPGLLITAPMKMRHGTDIAVTFEGDISETTLFLTDPGVRAANWAAAQTLVSQIGKPLNDHRQARPGGRDHTWPGSYIWKGVSGKLVAEFLRAYRSHPEATKIQGSFLADFVEAQIRSSHLTEWVVGVMSKREGSTPTHFTHPLGSLPVRLLKRTSNQEDQEAKENAGVVHNRIQSTNLGLQSLKHELSIQRLVSPRDEALDLGSKEYAQALDETRKAWTLDRGRSRRTEPPDVPSGPALRSRRPAERGLLLLYPLNPLEPEEAQRRLEQANGAEIRLEETPLLGVAVSFPRDGDAVPIWYRVNNVYWKQEYGA